MTDQQQWQAEPAAPNDRFPHCTTCNEEFFPFCARGDCPGSAALEKAATAQAEPQPRYTFWTGDGEAAMQPDPNGNWLWIGDPAKAPKGL